MRLIDADAMMQQIDKRLEELKREGNRIAENWDGDFDVLIDHLMLGSEIRTLKEWMAAQPTVDAEPVRRGYWVEYDLNKWKCSECGRENYYAFIHDAFRFKLRDRYCPSCGARMEG